MQYGSNSLLRNIPQSISLPKAPPKTSYEMQRHWRSLGSSPQLRARYLQDIKPSSLPKIFINSIEPQFLADIITTIVDLPLSSAVSSWLDALHQLPRLDMTIMLLSQADKERIIRALEEIVSKHGSEVTASVESMRLNIK